MYMSIGRINDYIQGLITFTFNNINCVVNVLKCKIVRAVKYVNNKFGFLDLMIDTVNFKSKN